MAASITATNGTAYMNLHTSDRVDRVTYRDEAVRIQVAGEVMFISRDPKAGDDIFTRRKGSNAYDGLGLCKTLHLCKFYQSLHNWGSVPESAPHECAALVCHLVCENAEQSDRKVSPLLPMLDAFGDPSNIATGRRSNGLSPLERQDTAFTGCAMRVCSMAMRSVVQLNSVVSRARSPGRSPRTN